MSQDQPNYYEIAKKKREDMTDEEIQQYVEQEQADLDKRLEKFRQNREFANMNSEVDEEEEDAEVFRFDQDNNVAWKDPDSDEGTVDADHVIGEYQMAEPKSERDQIIEDLQRDMMNIIANQTIADAIKEMRQMQEDMDTQTSGIAHQYGIPANEWSDSIDDHIKETRALGSVMFREGSDGEVNWESIPDWLMVLIKRNIRQATIAAIRLGE